MKMKENWKPVTISGITGILMGAGSVLAAREFTTGNEEAIAESSDELKETTVDDSMSFKEAFDTARAELGPGGIFHWRGNIFNTYTSDEWNGMTDEDKNEFAQNVNPEVSPEDVDTDLMAEAEVDDEVVEVVDDLEDVAQEVSVVAEETTSDNDLAMATVAEVQEENLDETGDNDVRVIGYGDIDLANGRAVTVEELEINGQRVAVIDVDQDGVGDIAMSDLNHNNQADDGEIIDLHTGDVLAFDHNNTSVEDVDSDVLTMMDL